MPTRCTGCAAISGRRAPLPGDRGPESARLIGVLDVGVALEQVNDREAGGLPCDRVHNAEAPLVPTLDGVICSRQRSMDTGDIEGVVATITPDGTVRSLMQLPRSITCHLRFLA